MDLVPLTRRMSSCELRITNTEVTQRFLETDAFPYLTLREGLSLRTVFGPLRGKDWPVDPLFLYFVLEWKNALCHTTFTSLVIAFL